jgi:hypothetical protein
MGRQASAREGTRQCGGSIQLHPSAGEGRTLACGAVATDRTSSLTGWAHLSVRGRRQADWARKGGGDGPKLFLGLKSNRVKENQS